MFNARYRMCSSCIPKCIARDFLMRAWLSCAAMLAVLSVSQTSGAATLAVDPGSGGFENANYPSNVTFGWGFTLASSLTVTGLGFFDGNSGLADPHPVGIWDNAGDLLATATVPAGTAAMLVSGFRFAPIASVVLNPGTFTIGAYANVTSPDEFRWEVQSMTAVAGLSFGPVDLYTQADSLTRPTRSSDVFTQFGYFGPDFLVGTADAVPEPRTIGITLLGLTIVMWRLFRHLFA